MENNTSSQTTVVEKPATEERKAYGTAKTENLRDSGLWRIILPAFVAACCLILIAFPLIILTPLFLKSLDPHAASNVLGRPLTWVWIVMAIVEAGIIIVIVRGLIKIFMTQAGNYH
ncbi:MAG: hypothetical protein NVS3B14_21710 [Ktedonobacteraceae bacterium]